LAAFLVLLLVAVLPTAASGASKGRIGGPPTIKLGPPDEGKRTTPALVIGRGGTAGGAAEVVAYGWESEDDDSLSADFCVWAEQLPDEILFGTCGPAPWRAGSIGMEMKIQRFGPGSARATYIGGLVSPDVASVRISFRRPGSGRLFRVNPILGRVRGGLQQRLDQPAPFEFYYAQVNGLVKFRQVRAEALDAKGDVVGTTGRK
jgi:hypothetical protein